MPARWHLALDARFGGSHLDTSLWATCYPWMDHPSGCRNFGNPERQWYLPGQATVSGGALNLTARREPTMGQSASGAPQQYQCRSGMVTSYPGFRFTYGYVQTVAQIPAGHGLWPALWLAAANQGWPPEIDMLEHWGVSRTSGVVLHAVGGAQIAAWPGTPGLFAGWHTIGLLWTPSRLRWTIDGRTVMTLSRDVPRQPMYLVADLAVYAVTASSGCSGQLRLRSVRVWQP